MLERRAILIDSGDRKIPGTKADIRYYKQFLTSPQGGFWHENEICVLEKRPLWDLVSQKLEETSQADYLFIAFSGHGFHPEGTNNPEETRLKLNDRENISIRHLNSTASRIFIIADSCRDILPLHEYSEVRTKMASDFESRRDLFRRMFDYEILKTPKGRIFTLSCSENEEAGEYPTGEGGYFSKAFIDAAQEWSESQETGRFTVEQAFEQAKLTVEYLTSGRQVPKFYAGRRMTCFPLAVWV